MTEREIAEVMARGIDTSVYKSHGWSDAQIAIAASRPSPDGERLAKAALAALKAAGLAIVSKEPTARMVAAAFRQRRDDLEPTALELCEFYRAMLLAASKENDNG